METFHQLDQRRNLVNRKRFRITDTGVRVDERTFFGERSFSVSYESISNDGFVFTRYSKYAFWLFVGCSGAGGILVLLSLVTTAVYTSAALLYLSMAVAFGLRFLLSRATYIGFRTSGDPLLLFKDNPTKSAVDAFLAELQKRKHEYLFQHYGTSQQLSPAEELQRLVWLKEKGTISAEEFQLLKRRIIKETVLRQSPLDFMN